MIFLDTNVVVYVADKPSNKREITLDLLTARPGISVQVVNETVAVLRYKKRMGIEESAEVARNIIRVCNVFSLTSMDVQLAMRLSADYQFNHWDALIVANALNNNGTELYSEDFQHGMTLVEGLKISNPFMR